MTILGLIFLSKKKIIVLTVSDREIRAYDGTIGSVRNFHIKLEKH